MSKPMRWRWHGGSLIRALEKKYHAVLTPHGYKPLDTSSADAKLIAAAPLLMEALGDLWNGRITKTIFEGMDAVKEINQLIQEESNEANTDEAENADEKDQRQTQEDASQEDSRSKRMDSRAR